MYKDYDRLIEDLSLSSMRVDVSMRFTNEHQQLVKFVATIGLSCCLVQYPLVVGIE